MLSSKHTLRQNRKQSNFKCPPGHSCGRGPDIEVVGNKTHGELETDWLKHFRASQPTRKPEGKGWMTLRQMAIQSGCGEASVRRYIKKNKDNYDRFDGLGETSSGNRVTIYYRFVNRFVK